MYKATKEIKGKMTDMQVRMQEQQRAQAAQQKQYEQDKVKQTVKPVSEDYIDYEEVKWGLRADAAGALHNVT